MAKIVNRGGVLYLEFYDSVKGYSTKISLKVKDTRENRRMANEVKKKYEAELIPVYKLQNKKEPVPKFSELFGKYLLEKDYKKSTMGIYEEASKAVLESLGDRVITEYRVEDNLHLRDYYVSRGYKQNTQSIKNRTLRSFFNWCIKRKIISENPIEVIKEESKPVEIIPEAELKELLAYAKKRNKAAYYFINFLKMTGFRKSSALALKWEQINFKEKIITADNVKKDRMFEFPLTKELIKLFKEMGGKEEGEVFGYKNDGLKFWYRYQRRLGFKKIYGLHQLRKTFISGLVNDNYSLYDVAVLADHRSIKTTMKHYTKANINRIREQLNGGK